MWNLGGHRTTSYRRLIDVETTSCVYWVIVITNFIQFLCRLHTKDAISSIVHIVKGQWWFLSARPEHKLKLVFLHLFIVDRLWKLIPDEFKLEHVSMDHVWSNELSKAQNFNTNILMIILCVFLVWIEWRLLLLLSFSQLTHKV